MLKTLQDIFRQDRLPWVTLGVAVLAAVSCLAGWESVLIYDRAAVNAGQIWRVITGNVVHFGYIHAFVDIGLFLILGRLLEWQNRRLHVVSLTTLAILVTASVHFFDLQMTRYAGLSGINLGWLVYLALQGWQRKWTDWFWPAVLALYVAEIVEESFWGHGMVQFDDPNVRVATIAHIGGAVAAVAVWLFQKVPSRSAGRLARKSAATSASS